VSFGDDEVSDPMTDRPRPTSLHLHRDRVEDRRRTLERRLDDGFQRIDQALHDGTDVAAWEDFWIQLLREYEFLCDELLAA
jgi:hypothetical protein